MKANECNRLRGMAKFHWCQWLLFWADGMAIGRHVFFNKDRATDRLKCHELRHVEQYSRFLLLGQWWIAVPVFWIVYGCQWVGSAFKCLFFKREIRKFFRCAYRNIPYEIEARASEVESWFLIYYQ